MSQPAGQPEGGGPWEQLVASLLAQHTALLHKLAAVAPPSAVLPCTPALQHALTPSRSPALSLGHHARRNWRNRRNRQRKKLRRLYHHANLEAGPWRRQDRFHSAAPSTTPALPTPPLPPTDDSPASPCTSTTTTTTTTTHFRRTLRSVVRYMRCAY
ncbi:hypothetical protein E2C01_067079 [Portunus trituberculatus]|uniref:Uncharacterized protein n=1 Tax=Portunus trituberculatus TaxID=210409 RepID=A0A5B7HSP0_PORTR|nr:hypothetical protein [Portunus trituberculatus]